MKEFYKLDNRWYYPLPEFDTASKEEIENLFKQIKLSFEYNFAPEADIWHIKYKKHKFTLVVDLVYGAELRADNIELLDYGYELLKLIASVSL